MKAIVYKNYGSPDVLQVSEVPKPSPQKNEILIKVHAAEATKSDCELRSFNFPVKWFWLPLRIAFGIRRPRNPILGGYFAGEVVELGSEVTEYQMGQQVFGSAQRRMGTYGQFLCLPASYTIVTKPKNMSYEEAAAVPLGGLNALHFMRKAKIQKGDKVLIHGAGGSIGSFAIQIAKASGAEVTAVDHGRKKQKFKER